MKVPDRVQRLLDDRKAMDRAHEKAEHRHKMQERNRTFFDRLGMMKDKKTIKNIRCSMGCSESDEATRKYEDNYAKAFGHDGAVHGSTGHYKWDDKQKKLVKVSDEVSTGFKGLVTV